MASFNKVFLLGHLGKDPVLRMTTTQKAVTSFTMATSTKVKNNQGTYEDNTEWHNVVCWGHTAEACSKFLKKGSPVFVEGRIQSRRYEKDGTERTVMEIIAESVQFLHGRDTPTPATTNKQDYFAKPSTFTPQPMQAPGFTDMEIPF